MIGVPALRSPHQLLTGAGDHPGPEVHVALIGIANARENVKGETETRRGRGGGVVRLLVRVIEREGVAHLLLKGGGMIEIERIGLGLHLEQRR